MFRGHRLPRQITFQSVSQSQRRVLGGCVLVHEAHICQWRYTSMAFNANVTPRSVQSSEPVSNAIYCHVHVANWMALHFSRSESQKAAPPKGHTNRSAVTLCYNKHREIQLFFFFFYALSSEVTRLRGLLIDCYYYYFLFGYVYGHITFCHLATRLIAQFFTEVLNVTVRMRCTKIQR